MAVSIMLQTDRNMGDHGEIVRVAIPYVENETVEALFERVREAHGMFAGGRGRAWNVYDVIELRMESEAAAAPTEAAF